LPVGGEKEGGGRRGETTPDGHRSCFYFFSFKKFDEIGRRSRSLYSFFFPPSLQKRKVKKGRGGKSERGGEGPDCGQLV